MVVRVQHKNMRDDQNGRQLDELNATLRQPGIGEECRKYVAVFAHGSFRLMRLGGVTTLQEDGQADKAIADTGHVAPKIKL